MTSALSPLTHASFSEHHPESVRPGYDGTAPLRIMRTTLLRLSLPLHHGATKASKEAKRRQTCVQPPRLMTARRALKAQRARLSASHRGSCSEAFAPFAQLQARLPGTWQDVRSCTATPTGEQRSCALTRALPAPACPSPGNAPPGPAVVP